MHLYEMHCHASETSKCAKIGGADLVDFYHALGYAGVAITDHFFNGNTTVPKELPWADRVELFTGGYRAAKQRGDELGMEVFFGWEFTHEGKGNHFLTYGLGVDWLLAHPDCDQLHVNDYCDLVHEAGGYVVHAHPFRESNFVNVIRLVPRKVDGVEIVNANRKMFENRMADLYAVHYGLCRFCGSDLHSSRARRLAAMALPERAACADDILAAVRRGEAGHVYLERNEDGVWQQMKEFSEE